MFVEFLLLLRNRIKNKQKTLSKSTPLDSVNFFVKNWEKCVFSSTSCFIIAHDCSFVNSFLHLCKYSQKVYFLGVLDFLILAQARREALRLVFFTRLRVSD